MNSLAPLNAPKVALPTGSTVYVPPVQLPCSQGRFALVTEVGADAQVVALPAVLSTTERSTAPLFALPGLVNLTDAFPEVKLIVPVGLKPVSQATRLGVRARNAMLILVAEIVVQPSLVLVTNVAPAPTLA